MENTVHKIGILGSGRVASVLARRLASVGHHITIGTRDTAQATARWSGPPVAFADLAETARAASVIINATPGDTSVERLGALREALTGRILIDVANATERGEDGMPAKLLYPNSSLAEALQQALPGTAVVKTLNTMLFMVMANPECLGISPTVFLSGNDESAKAVAQELLGDLGWAPDQIEDLGDIRTARGPEALVLLVPALIRKRGVAPFAVTIAR